MCKKFCCGCDRCSNRTKMQIAPLSMLCIGKIPKTQMQYNLPNGIRWIREHIKIVKHDKRIHLLYKVFGGDFFIFDIYVLKQFKSVSESAHISDIHVFFPRHTQQQVKKKLHIHNQNILFEDAVVYKEIFDAGMKCEMMDIRQMFTHMGMECWVNIVTNESYTGDSKQFMRICDELSVTQYYSLRHAFHVGLPYANVCILFKIGEAQHSTKILQKCASLKKREHCYRWYSEYQDENGVEIEEWNKFLSPNLLCHVYTHSTDSPSNLEKVRGTFQKLIPCCKMK